MGATINDQQGSDYATPQTPVAVYIYEFDGSNWVQMAKLTAPSGHVGDYYGCEVEIDGDSAAVSALDMGKVFMYRYNAGSNTWDLEDTINSVVSTPSAFDNFGYAIKLVGDTLMVGHPDLSVRSSYIFKCSASTGLWGLTYDMPYNHDVGVAITDVQLILIRTAVYQPVIM